MYKTKKLHYSSFLLAFIALFFCGKDSFAMMAVETKVDKISSLKKTAISDNTYDNGFKWEIDVTIPENETFISMKFDDLKFGTSNIPVAKNLRYYSKQASIFEGDSSLILVSKAGEYDDDFEINPMLDLDKNKPGVQIKIEVEVAVKKDTLPGNYSLNYSLKSVDKNPPIITIGDYIKTPTNMDVVVGASVNEGLLNEISHTFIQNGTFVFEATDSAGNKANKSVTVDNIYKELPSITIRGSAHMVVERYSKYVEPGYSVVMSPGYYWWSTVSSLKTDVVGDYKIFYYSKDPFGNIASTSRSIKVVDTTPPTILIDPYITSPVNTDIEVSASAIGGTLNFSKHTFAQNGEFVFIATDDIGNSTSSAVKISNIDKEAPVIHLEGPVTVLLERGCGDYQDYGAKVTDNMSIYEKDYSTSTDEFGLNLNIVGDYIVRYNAKDKASNIAEGVSRTIQVRDTKYPLITINDYIKTLTNKDIIVTATTNEGVLNTTSHTFTKNGSFDFVADDKNGHISTSTVIISNIDKEAPEIHLTGLAQMQHERGEPFVDPYATITDNNPISVSAIYTYLWLDINKVGLNSIAYDAFDTAGNKAIRVGRHIYVVDTKPPVITIGDYIKTPTNKDIVVTATTNEGVLNTTSHTFTKNGSFDFVADDKNGHITTLTVIISNIDKLKPTVRVLGGKLVFERWDKIIDPGVVCEDVFDINNYASGIASCDSDANTIDTSTTTDPLKDYFITYRIYDNAGNESIATRKYEVMDTKPPVITTWLSTDKPYNGTMIAVFGSVTEGSISPMTCLLEKNGQSCRFVAVDEFGHESSKTVTVTNFDKTKPTINLIGSGIVEIYTSDIYSELGATVSDDMSQNIQPVIDSNLIQGVEGDYYIKYNAEDEAGNKADEIMRTIIVKAKEVASIAP